MAATPVDASQRLAGAQALTTPAAKKRMLVIVNPYASTVSDRLRNLVVYALRGRYELEAVDTQEPGHATQLCRDAAREGYDVVVAFGGDGTLNEAANGLAGSATALTCLPGGSTNVVCRTLGIPDDVVDATEHLLRIADAWAPRRVDLAEVNGRGFLFASGIGLDAAVVQRLNAHPRIKAGRAGHSYAAYTAISQFAGRYAMKPPRLAIELDGEPQSGTLLVVQNSDPFTYFGRRPIHLASGAALDSGKLAAVVLRRLNPIDLPSLAYRMLSRRDDVAGHPQVSERSNVTTVHVRSVDGRAFPLHVDGDDVGDVDEASYSVRAGALVVVA